MIDMREKDETQLQCTVTTTDVTNYGLVTFPFPSVSLVAQDIYEMFLEVSRKSLKALLNKSKCCKHNCGIPNLFK